MSECRFISFPVNSGGITSSGGDVETWCEEHQAKIVQTGTQTMITRCLGGQIEDKIGGALDVIQKMIEGKANV